MMRSWKLFALLAVAALVTACGASQPALPSPGNTDRSAAGSTGAPSTGSSASSSPVISLVAGQVSAGPVTPVSRPGQPNARPVAGARVEALRGAEVVALTSTNQAGNYSLQLAPGSYLIAVSYPGMRPLPMEKTAVVSAGQSQTLDFVLDTGIR